MNCLICLKVDHGAPHDMTRHVGDLGNIVTPVTGSTWIEIVDSFITLDESSENSILDRALVIHADADDLGQGGDAGSIATGNAGARLACGLIMEVMPCMYKH